MVLQYMLWLSIGDPIRTRKVARILSAIAKQVLTKPLQYIDSLFLDLFSALVVLILSLFVAYLSESKLDSCYFGGGRHAQKYQGEEFSKAKGTTLMHRVAIDTVRDTRHQLLVCYEFLGGRHIGVLPRTIIC